LRLQDTLVFLGVDLRNGKHGERGSDGKAGELHGDFLR
jgi:hypothetical protein